MSNDMQRNNIMADSRKTTTTTTFSIKTSSDRIGQQMDSSRMTTANVSHHNQQKEDEQQNAQSSGIACGETKTTTTIGVTTTIIIKNPEKLHTLLSLPTGMELSQIELIYRAEGNANLVLALPQFKKVLRLPKSTVRTVIAPTITTANIGEDIHSQPAETTDCNLKSPLAQSELLEEQHQKPHKQAEKASAAAIAIPIAKAKATATPERESQSRPVSGTGTGHDLKMKDFTSYMQIFRQILGVAYVLTADICWIHREDDRKWINKHIKAARPAHRLDKEFCGQFGLLLPDATQLPLPSIREDILHSNLQEQQWKQPEAKVNENIFAIEIKPKQGWQLFPNPDGGSSSSTSTSTSTGTGTATSHLDIEDLFDIGAKASPMPCANPTAAPTLTPTADKVGRTTVARCRYCAMQFLKLKNRRISNMNTYCPIELFSGTPSRMFIALDALFRCPQNNLRVFKNGILIYGDHASSISYEEVRHQIFPGDAFQLVKELLVECLLRDYDDCIEIKKPLTGVTGIFGQPHSSVATTKMGSKQATVALKIIQTDPDTETRMKTKTKMKTEEPCEQQIQETESKMEMEMAMRTGTETVQVKTSPSPLPSASASISTSTTRRRTKFPNKAVKTSARNRVRCSDAEMPCLPKNCILQKILHLQLLIKHNLFAMKNRGYGNYWQRTYNGLRSLLRQNEPFVLENLQPNEQYLLGATALDCSIMITFQEISYSGAPNDPEVVIFNDFKHAFRTKVTVLDLDPKPDSHFAKYIQQTKEAYEESSKN